MSDSEELWRLGLMAGAGRTPFAQALGAEMVTVERGRVRMRVPYSERLIGNPDTGVVHGGVITAFLDQSCGMAVGSTLKELRSFATLSLRPDYITPPTPPHHLVFPAPCFKLPL